jgi:hypothetical protein
MIGPKSQRVKVAIVFSQDFLWADDWFEKNICEENIEILTQELQT